MVSSLEKLLAVTRFFGQDHNITAAMVYTVDFICTYNMINYPFDIQVCSAIFLMTLDSDQYTHLELGKFVNQAPTVLSTYYIMDAKLVHFQVKLDNFDMCSHT